MRQTSWKNEYYSIMCHSGRAVPTCCFTHHTHKLAVTVEVTPQACSLQMKMEELWCHKIIVISLIKTGTLEHSYLHMLQSLKGSECLHLYFQCSFTHFLWHIFHSLTQERKSRWTLIFFFWEMFPPLTVEKDSHQISFSAGASERSSASCRTGDSC